MKKLLSAILAIVMIVTAVPLTVLADSPTPAAQSSVTTNTNQDEGVILTKMATPRLGLDGKPDGTIDITIEAYTTGVVTSSTTVVPANIILVLDTSGSMDDGGSYETRYTYTSVFGELYQTRSWEGGMGNGGWVYTDAYGFESGTYYILVDGSYVSVRSAGTDNNGFQYYSYRSGNKTTYVYPILDSDPADVRRQNNYSVVQFYSRQSEQIQTSKNRMDLLIDGVNGFIDETYKANEGIANDADKHAIAIIKFADDSYYNGRSSTQNVDEAVVGNNKNSSGYNYSQVVSPLTIVNQAGVADLEAHVSELSPGGATSVDYGLALATDMISDASNSQAFRNRKNVVVVFTDGEPNHQSGYDQSVAATCISQAKALKDIGVTIFTICVADNADATAALPSSNSNINKFMHYLSSNFPNATVGNNNVLDDGIADSQVSEAMSRGFYQTPNQDMSLESIFEVIAQSIEKPTIEVGESATLVDTVSPYFTIPEGATGVEILTSEKTADGWADPVNAGSSVTLNIQSDRTVTVSGFNFDENYVSETARNGFYGKKLIITFNIAPNYEALDKAENAVDANGKIKTNLGDASLNDSSMKAVASVASPELTINKVTYVVDGTVYKTVYRFAGAEVTLIDEPADTAALDYDTWTSTDVTIEDGKFVMPEEDVIISLTSTTKSYKVTYRYTGTVPEDTPEAPAEAVYQVGATVQVEDAVSVEGYDFVGWNTVSATVTDGEFTMPAYDVEFIGYFNAGTVIYTVEHYLQNADGTWPEDPSTSHTHDGKTGETVTAHTDIVYPNFTLDLTHKGTIDEGTVEADGSLVLKLYYNRAKNSVTYEYVGSFPDEAAELPDTKDYYYGAEVTVAPVPTVAGYTFVGWATDGADVIIIDGANGKTFTMPARNVTIKGTFVPNTGTSYKVEHYLETVNGTYELANTTSHTGITDTEANAVPGNYPSYSHNPDHPNARKRGNIEGDGSLVLKLYYDRDPMK